MLAVDEAGTERARTVVLNGAPELREAVKQGHATIRAAADIARLPQAQQREILTEIAAAPDGRKALQDVARTIRIEGPGAVNGARAIMSSRQEPDDSLDYFPTPPWATRALFEHVFRHLKMTVGSAWDPACGEGHMAEAMREYVAGEVHSSDIFDYGYGEVLDYLAEPYKAPDAARSVQFVITNPPFGNKTESFFRRAIDEATGGVALFVRLQWLETRGRYERIFRDTPPTLIAFFSERVPLCKGRWNPDGDTATAYIWLVWIKGRAPQAPFWIPPDCRSTCARPGDEDQFTARPVIRAMRPLRVADDGSPTNPTTGVILPDSEAVPAPDRIAAPAVADAPTAMSAEAAGAPPSSPPPSSPPPHPIADEDRLEIPAFLRRDQNNELPGGDA
jgi:predicted RNA methylase